MAPVPGSSGLIEKTVADNKVVLWSKSTCPFCDRIKSLLTSLNVDYLAIELDQRGGS